MKRVFVLGHGGMLGHVVVSHLTHCGYEVITSGLRYEGGPGDPLLQAVRNSGCEWVINALGAIPQKKGCDDTMYRANTFFPLHLLQTLGGEQKLIHASSDCVFSGKTGGYATAAERDADSIYGLSKALGETVALDPRVLCLRVSIVGPELGGGGKGLLAWFLGQSGSVTGYTNHLWNGITTLEWAKVADEVMQGVAPCRHGLVQVGSPEVVSKFELLQWFAEAWERQTTVIPADTSTPVDRTLKPDWIRPSLKQQLVELKAWQQAGPALDSEGGLR